ncbi:helix-turn-helix domain-containing protein [Streptomyces uncialis]|uniref:helix-turn-helix domain-containing protein n=1 Tax=Streptomyces uncialis TaxID=1048205 RepID=UPI002255DCC6|nr:helix-turn-helix transcriptional regulator [Streptomyces uncialis]MCX4664836.1 helix-turn-helix domain-containing protein [Streptomyces uncialis]
MSLPDALRALRGRAGLSLGALAARTHYDRSHLHHVETGRRRATRAVAESLDHALGADGELFTAWERDERVRRRDAALHATRASALAVSHDLCGLAELDVDDLYDGVEEIAVVSRSTPPALMAERAHVLRDEALHRIRAGQCPPTGLADLYVAVGRLSGVLAYALLDLGCPHDAMRHAEAAASCADRAGDADLAVWVAGTRSLIARSQGDFPLALDLARGGLRRAGSGRGTGRARLKCGEAQCLANMGDSAGANSALNVAEDARERVRGDAPGLFGFSRAKQFYYAGSSLIWLDGGEDARRALRAATDAIAIWQSAPAGQRSLVDERLAHIYAATAHAQLGDVEGAADTVRPLLSLPPEDQISWIVKRMDRLARLLSAPYFQGNTTAHETAEAIRTLAGP